jgi:hypothetical protein
LWTSSGAARHATNSQLSLGCWACASSSTTCDYYSGGAVPTPATCAPAIANGLLQTTITLPNATRCGHPGCQWCLKDGQRQRVLQVYRRTPTGISAAATIPVYVGAAG